MPPAYHLRPKKAIDRLLLVEILRLLQRKHGNLNNFTYVGLGGPFLEDLRLLGQTFPEMALTSVEQDAEVYKRQDRHRCAKNIALQLRSMEDFLQEFEPGGRRYVIWLDYTNLSPVWFQQFQTALDAVPDDSVVKITLRARYDERVPEQQLKGILADAFIRELQEKQFAKFREVYEDVFPPDVTLDEVLGGQFPAVLQRMLRIVAENTLPAAAGRVFQILHSCHYDDGTRMLTLTGIVCRTSDAEDWRKVFASLKHRNLDWSPPVDIDIPVLSVRERLLLEPHLPDPKTSGAALRDVLGYEVVDSGDSAKVLQNYADLQNYYPFFAKVNVV